jgi:hypothetical protein
MRILRFYPRKLHHWTIITVNPNRVAKVRCKCGTRRDISLSMIRKHVKSCGCWKREAARKQIKKNRPANARLTHGGTTPEFLPLYRVYHRMLARCYNPNASGYKNYGGRGIRVCPEWRGENGFPTWLRDMGGVRPKKMTMDRIDVNGDYKKSNVRWASRKTQRANQRPRKRVE